MKKEPILLHVLVDILVRLKKQEMNAIETAGIKITADAPQLGSIEQVRNFTMYGDACDIDMGEVEQWSLIRDIPGLKIPLVHGSNLCFALLKGTKLVNLSPTQFRYVENGYVLDEPYGAKWKQFRGEQFVGKPNTLLVEPPTIEICSLTFILNDRQGRAYFLYGL